MLSIKPDLAGAHLSLGIALGENGDLDAAMDQFRVVLKLQPGNTEARKNLQLVLEMKADGAR